MYEIAEDLGVSVSIIYGWSSKFPEFAAALKGGGDQADDRVEMALFEKATGYKWKEKVITKKLIDGEVIEEVTEVEKQTPPDNASIQFYLKNKRSHKWKDKHEVTVTHNVNMITSHELQQLLSPYIDGEVIDVTPNDEDQKEGS
jgi:hypothetical protein